MTYRLVISGEHSSASALEYQSLDAALAMFHMRAPEPQFRPDGSDRMRVVDEQQWHAIEATAARRAAQ